MKPKSTPKRPRPAKFRPDNIRIRKIDEFNPGVLRMGKLCRARKSIPSIDGLSSVLFTCNLEAGHPPETFHVENGRVRTRAGVVSDYSFAWLDQGNELWRQEVGGPVQEVALKTYAMADLASPETMEKLRKAVTGESSLEQDIPDHD